MLKKALLLFLLVFQVEAFAAKSIPLPPKNYIYDEVNLLGSSTDSLSSILSQEDRQFGNQILIAVFNSIEQEDLVDYTNRVFTSWQPGEKAKSNGAILAIYLKERKIRIEVGYGLEPFLTDAISKRIIVNVIGPAFAEKKYSEGIIGAVQEMKRIIHSDPEAKTPREPKQRKKPKGLFFLFALIIFGVLKIIDRFNPQTLSSSGIHRSGWGGGFGGGGSGWGGGDSGGFSGGGGSSGGGGASGDW